MLGQFLVIPAARATAERVFTFVGLTLSDLCKSLLEDTRESIMKPVRKPNGGLPVFLSG